MFFPLKVSLFKMWFHLLESYSTIQKLVFDNTDRDILRVCVHLLLIVN